jgi:hypothetical protein
MIIHLRFALDKYRLASGIQGWNFAQIGLNGADM